MADRGTAKRILVVDDEAEARESIRALLEDHGFAVNLATDGRSALRACESDRPDLVLTDLFMPELDGIGLITALREIAPDLPIIAMANRIKPFTVDYVDIATKLGAFGGLYKPLDGVALLRLLERALYPYRSLPPSGALALMDA
jgi:DNA-binding NtrC family response regulator